MYHELWNGSAKAIVSTDGGYVTNLSNDKGDIFYPKRTLKAADGSEKLRGGCHVCLPNFGPGGDSGLDQHGFGRTSEWSVVTATETSIELEFSQNEGDYSGLVSHLAYVLAEDSFAMTLTIKNQGANPMRLAPAFHPYFACMGADDVMLDDQRQILDELGEAIFFNGRTHQLVTPTHDITLVSETLPTWVKWTDRLGQYVCVEPSYAGFAFLEPVVDEQLLEPGVERAYSVTVRWRP